MNDCKQIYDAKLDQTMQNYYLDADEMRQRVLRHVFHEIWDLHWQSSRFCSCPN